MTLNELVENIDLTIAVHENGWYDISPDFEEYVGRVCNVVLQHQIDRLHQYCPASSSEPIGIALVFTNSREVQKLNKEFRGKDAPTNVLSFAADMEGLQPEDQEIILGDVIFAYEVIAAEATEQNKHLIHHLTHMIVHGLLHLLGYDHIIDEQAEDMEQIECDILALFKIANPYDLYVKND